MIVAFVVHGLPHPQGSKVRVGRFGLREANPGTRPWRNMIAEAAVQAIDGRPLLTGPLRLDITFRFPRPRSHYGTGRNAGKIKSTAPVYAARNPDLDKLVRAVGDALTGTAIQDDALIVELRARKTYGSPCAQIAIAPIGEDVDFPA